MVVHKPGTGDQTDSADDVVGAIEAVGHRVVYYTIDDDVWIRRADGVDLVVAAGGDGTVGTVFETLAGHDVAIAVLPLGTANNIATSLGIETDKPYISIPNWPRWHRRKFEIPAAQCEHRRTCFVERVGGGLFSDLLEAAAAQKHESGRRITIDDALQLLRRIVDEKQPERWVVTIDGRDFTGEYLAVEVLNISYTGPAIAFSNHAKVGDGLVDVLLIATAQRRVLRDYIGQRLVGQDPRPLDLPYAQGRSVCLRPPANATLHIDDHLSGKAHTLEVSTGRTHVTILTPQQRSSSSLR